MILSTEIANAVVATGPKAQYDAQVKRLGDIITYSDRRCV